MIDTRIIQLRMELFTIAAGKPMLVVLNKSDTDQTDQHDNMHVNLSNPVIQFFLLIFFTCDHFIPYAGLHHPLYSHEQHRHL